MPDIGQVKVMNTALGLLGQEPTPDLSDEALAASIAATKLLRVFDDARDVVLARHGWLCALSYATLAPTVIAGDVNWKYPTVFVLPGDAIRVWEIEGEREETWAPRWQAGTIESATSARKIIRASASAWSGAAVASLNVAFIRRANWEALDVHVRDTVAFEVAARGCYSVTADKALADKLAQRAEAKAVMAVSVEATQEGGQPPWAGSIPQAIRNATR